MRSTAHDAADQFIRPFGRRKIQNARDDTRFNDRFHRPTAGASGVKDKHFKPSTFEQFPCMFNTLRRVAKHRSHNERFVAIFT